MTLLQAITCWMIVNELALIALMEYGRLVPRSDRAP